MSKINRFFERIIKEEISSEIININGGNFYAYGVSNEGELYSPYNQIPLILSSRADYAESLAESNTNSRLMGSAEIPTVTQCIVNNARVIQWNKQMDMQYGELFQNNIVAPQKLSMDVAQSFRQYDGILHVGKINNYLILFNPDGLSVYRYKFYTKEHGWDEWYGKNEALDILNGIFEFKDSSTFF